MWHNYVNITILNHKTYHAGYGCEPSRVFHWRLPYNVHVLDLTMGIGLKKPSISISQIVQSLTKSNRFYEMHAEMQCEPASNTMPTMTKKAKASKLKECDYVYVLQPKAAHQGCKILVKDFRWIWPYIVETALLDNNYLVWESGTVEMLVI